MGRGFSIKTFVTQACVLIMSAAMALPVSARERRSCYEETVQPPVYQTLHEQVLVKAPSVKVITHPPVYADRTRHVVLKPASVGYQTIAPVFRWQTRKVLVRPAGVRWEYQLRKGKRILCEVQYPAVYQNQRQQVMVSPASRVKVTFPPVYGTVQERVQIQPGWQERVRQPAVYRTVTRTVKVRDAQTVWRQVRQNGCRN